MSIDREIKVHIEPTPEELAVAFWHLNNEQQARFLNHLEAIAGDGLILQVAAITKMPTALDNGRRVMRLFGEYAEERPEEITR